MINTSLNKLKFLIVTHYKISIREFFFQYCIFSCCYSLAIFRIADIMIFNISEKDTKVVQVNLERGKIL